jgi:hypothetical protein
MFNFKNFLFLVIIFLLGLMVISFWMGLLVISFKVF